jgi:hypothetical protein
LIQLHISWYLCVPVGLILIYILYRIVVKR